MKTLIYLCTLLACSISHAQNVLNCEDGNNIKAYSVQLKIDFSQGKSTYASASTPCYVDPYDGYECDYNNPHVYTEKIIQWPALISVADGNSVFTKEIVVSVRMNTEDPDLSGYYRVYIHEIMGADNTEMSLSIAGGINPASRKFRSGFEFITKEDQYISINTLYLRGIDRPYYLKCEDW